MKKYFFIIFLLFFSTYLHAQDNLKFYIEKALENNLQLNAERKNFESAKQSKNISREVNFYQVLHFQEIKQVPLLQTELIKVEQV